MSRDITLQFHITAEGECSRIDRFISEEFELFTRSQYKARVVSATINGRPAKASSSVAAGDRIALEYLPEKTYSLAPEDIPLDIIFENDDVLVVNKNRGMVVHPGAGNPGGTLVNAFIHHCNPVAKLTTSEQFRPGIVHRLDKDTSGVIILAKNSAALEFLSAQFRNRTAEKTYLSLADGELCGSGRVSGFIRRGDGSRVLFIHDENRGKSALSEYRVLASTGPSPEYPKGLSLLCWKPLSGRTHQLRVHSKHIGAAIVGDPLYNPRFRRRDGQSGAQFSDTPLMLHAISLSILLPGESDKRFFTADIPADIKNRVSAAGFMTELEAFLSTVPEG